MKKRTGAPSRRDCFAASGHFICLCLCRCGGLNQNTAGASAPKDTIGQIQLETVPWEDRKDRPELDGDIVIDELSAALQEIPGIQIEVLELGRGPATAKPVHLRLKGDNWEDLLATTADMRALFDELGLDPDRRYTPPSWY